MNIGKSMRVSERSGLGVAKWLQGCAKCGVLGALVAMGMTVFAGPSVTVGAVRTGEPWSKITVNYTLGGTDAETEYKVAFEVTAGGQTASVTNGAAKLTDGAATKVIDTVALFGRQVADTKAKVKVTLIAIKPLGGVQLWENGPYWAECNVGATKPEEYGYYFWWGDTVGYTRSGGMLEDDYYYDVTWVSSTGTRMSSSPFTDFTCPTYGKTTAQLQSAGYIDSTGNLVAAHDAATVHLGAPWRMPTEAEFDALERNCDTIWTTRNGVYGWLVTGRGAYASRSIFLPAAGFGYDSFLYGLDWDSNDWSSTPLSNDSESAWFLAFDAGDSYRLSTFRYDGLSVRPVRGEAEFWLGGDEVVVASDEAEFRLGGDEVAIVPGETVAIDTGLIGYTASGLPSGLKYDKATGLITGSVLKPTAAGGVVVKFTQLSEKPEELTIVVTAIPTVSVAMEGVNSAGDVEGCKVAGAGAYLVGKTVTLKATAPKGTVFMGWFDGGEAVSPQATYAFTMDREDIALVARFKKEMMSVGCETLSSKGVLPAGVLGSGSGIALDITTESGVKSVKVDKLPTGMKYDAKTGLITGAPTKAGDNTVVITVTAVSGAVERREIKVSVSAMPETAVGSFNGFVLDGDDDCGTFQLTATDAGKLTAKVVTAAGTVSFAGTSWGSVQAGVYRATLATKKSETLTLELDSTAGWDGNQLSGEFTSAAVAATRTTAAVPSRTFSVSAQRAAFEKAWCFTAMGNEADGWTLAYTEDKKAAALTVTLKADGKTSLAGKLPGTPDAKGKPTTISASASGFANVGMMRQGAIAADFAPVVTVNKVKRALSIRTNLWFDRRNNHDEGVGVVKFVP